MRYRPAADCCSGGQTLDPSDRLAPQLEISSSALDSDAALVGRARTGDREAFAALYLRHHEAVAQVCRRRLRDPQLAEDATQETFLRAWKALPNFRHDVDLTHWLRRIARNHCHDLWRAAERGRFMTGGTDLLVEHEDPHAHDAVGAAADRIAVRTLLGRLRPRDAQLLVDHHAVGVSVHTLAQRWHMTKGAMEVALHRARQRARRCADTYDLRALVPLGASRRIVVWLQRRVADTGGVSSPAAAALGNLAVVAMVVVMPQMGPSGQAGAPTPPSPAHSTAATASPKVTGAAPSPWQPSVSPAVRASRDASTGKPPAAQRGKAREEQRREQALFDFEPVTVPVANREVRPTPDDDAQLERRYTVHNPVTGAALVGRETYKGRPSDLRPVDRHACPVADGGEPVTSCEEAAEQ